MRNILVVLLNFNSPDDTYRCLRSLAASSLQPQVVVVDNASTGDGLLSVEIAQSAYQNTHVIFNAHNDGFGGGNNVGIEWGLANSDAEFFFILNNDTVVLPDSISLLLDFIESKDKMGMCSPAIFHMNTPDVYWFGGGYIDWAKGGALSPNVNRRIGTEIGIANSTFISGCAMFVRREVMEKIQGFSNDYFMYCEDVDLCERVLRAGYTIGYDATNKILHHAHSSLVRDSDAYITPFSWRNKSAPFFAKHYVYGALLNLSKYSSGLERLKGNLSVLRNCIKWGVSYVLHARFDGLMAMFSGIKFFMLRTPPK